LLARVEARVSSFCARARLASAWAIWARITAISSRRLPVSRLSRAAFAVASAASARVTSASS